ncbi:AraC family transcriptional regulator [Novosphingobium mangrovi (ex Hu et al. 2023)]|uniref:AraC family transcriptional regulator n=1 Tax=Novosphingobium mangrovi (ex Hu et al. 2023) TaxID=2930094 RepID=A0ABT0AFZ1_9SPHN|nr:AraC family transcriptional regulator [Novosphingobium mangrovi (ex Hu et al. 2023)]MCJ1962115.1 AraC family transcriptional regulator [Novosphingobium mangrovi (ex Hu et al. 2023)]
MDDAQTQTPFDRTLAQSDQSDVSRRCADEPIAPVPAGVDPDFLDRLCGRARLLAQPDVTLEIIEGVSLFAASDPGRALARLYGPMASLVLQGRMEVTIGANALTYSPGSCFVGSIDLPVTGRIIEASPARPYMAIMVALDRETLADLTTQAGEIAPERTKCFALGPAPEGLLEACLRLLDLQAAERQADMAVLGPLVRREILYRMLQGPQSSAVHQLLASDPRIAQVRRAITWIRGHLDERVPIQDMASCARMSEASFRRHFRQATGMSPLQYQKTLRLQAARRAILSGSEVAKAAFAVGYESASQFSREYARLFGLPPAQDAKRLAKRS